MSQWVDRPGRGVAKFQFDAKDANQLSLGVNDIVEVKQENSGWFRGYPFGQPGALKLFPVSYVNFTPQSELPPETAPSPQPVPQSTSSPPFGGSPYQQPIASTPRALQTFGTLNTPQRSGSASGSSLLQLAVTGSSQQPQSTFKPQPVASPSLTAQQPFQQLSQPSQSTSQTQPFQLGPNYVNQQSNSSQLQQPATTLQSSLNVTPVQQTPADLSAVRGYNNSAGIPTYNPEPKQKTIASPTVNTSQTQIHFPAIFVDNRNEENSSSSSHEIGYVLPKSRDGVRPFGGTSTDHIIEVLDSYKLIDPLSSQYMLIDDGSSPHQQSGVSKDDEAANTLLQIRHAQQQSLSLSIDPALRTTQGNDTQSYTRVKSRHSEQRENFASPSTVNALFPTFDNTAQYLSGEASLPPKRYQLFLQVNVCIFSVNEYTELFFSLYSTTQGRYISEDYVVRLPPPGLPEHGTILGRMKTVFRDLSPEDLKSDLWLVCRIYRLGTLLVDKKAEAQPMSSSGKKDDKKKGVDTTVRRCFGCAATFVSQANLHCQIGKKYEPPPNQLTIYVPTQETTFADFPKLLIQRAKGLLKDSRDFDTVPRAKGIALSLTLFEGEIPQTRELNRTTLKEVGDTMKLDFPLYFDVRQPCTELQVNLHGCSALQDKKASARNIEIRVRLVRNVDYQDVVTGLYRGSASSEQEPQAVFATSVYYHTNTPNFNETFKIRCAPQLLQECHLYFELWHISTNPKKSACFSTCHFCLTTPSKNGPPRFVPDQSYSIGTYKQYSKDENYLNPSSQAKLQARKGETVSFSIQLNSTSLSSHQVLAELRTWQTVSQQRLGQLLLGLQLTSKSKPIGGGAANSLAGPSAFQSFSMSGPASSTANDDALPFIEITSLRQNMHELLNTLLAMFAASDRVQLQGAVFDGLVHIISRLVLEAYSMLEAYVSSCIRPDAAPGLWRLLGFLLGAMDHHTQFVVTSVEAVNAAGGVPQIAQTAAAASSGPTTPASPSQSGGHPSFNNDRRPSSTPTFSPQFTLMGTDTPNKNTPSTPGTPLHRPLQTGGQIPKLSFDDLDGPSSGYSQSTSTSPQVQVNDINPDELTPLQRFSLAAPFIIRIVCSLYTFWENQNKQARPPQQPRAPETTGPQPSSGSTPFISPGEALARADFKEQINSVFASIHTILAQSVSSDKARAIQISQSLISRLYPDCLLALTYNNSLSEASALFSCEEASGNITNLFGAVSSNQSLFVQHINIIKQLLTGVVGPIASAPDAMYTSVPLVHQLDTKNVGSPASMGWHRHTTSFLRSWLLAPRLYKSKALPTPSLHALLPIFLSSIQSIVTTSLIRGSLNEAMLAVPILEHIYAILYAANHNPTSDGSGGSYVDVMRDFYFTGQNMIANNGMEPSSFDISGKSPQQIFPASTFLELLPSLVTILYHYMAVYPKLDLPKSDTTHPGFMLPDWKTTNVAFVDLMPQTAFLIFSIFHITPASDVTTYFTSTLPREQAITLLTRLLFACNGFTTYSLVPKQWLDLDVFQRSSIIHIVKLTSSIISKNFNTDTDFSPFLWVYWLQLTLSCKGFDFFNMQGSTIRAAHINSKIERAAVEKDLIDLFHTMWNALTPAHKITTSPVLVERLIAVVSSPLADDNYKQLALNIYYQLLESEFATTQSFSLVERYTIDSLYEVANISPDRAHAAMDKMYNSTWAHFDAAALSDPDVASTLCADGRKFLDHLKNLFSLMSSLFTHPSDPEWEYDRTAVALRLIRYIEESRENSSNKSIDTESSGSSSGDAQSAETNAAQTRKAMHTRYIQYLVDLHVDHKNFCEAGISYVQQAKMLDWSPIILDSAGLDFPAESESERKIRLLDHSIDMLSKAHDYERCIQLIDYLRFYYQHITFNFSALSKQIQRQANFFNAMLSTTRVYSTYYRVVLYGKAAQDALSSAGNKLSNPNHTSENGIEFVYKGNTLEGVAPFSDRLKKRYTDAFFHMSSDRPTPEMMAQHRSIVSISVLVVPPAELRNDILSQAPEARLQYQSSLLQQDSTMITWQWGSPDSNYQHQLSGLSLPVDVSGVLGIFGEPPTVSNYRNNNRIYVFEYSKPWRRGEDKKPANEFIDLWLIRTYLIVEEPFPANRRRIEVIARVEKIQKPIQNAIEAIQNKTRDLAGLIQEVLATPPGEIADCRKLSMNLNGMIDAAVNGGTAKYCDGFFSPSFLSPEAIFLPEEKADINAILQERRKYQEQLKTALKEQFDLLQEGINVFARKADASQKGLILHLKHTLDTSSKKFTLTFG